MTDIFQSYFFYSIYKKRYKPLKMEKRKMLIIRDYNKYL